YIVGRMGIPYRKRNINIISVVIDAPQNEIASLSGKIGNLQPCSSLAGLYMLSSISLLYLFQTV
ncbi:MAG: hypothetical protein IIV42_02125, partial [Peptococcaceae bacterium]|nr:hypothetical protein [Peptococcaceae bacterium]